MFGPPPKLFRDLHEILVGRTLYERLRGFHGPLEGLLGLVREQDDRPRLGLDVTARWLDGEATDEALVQTWQAVPLVDRNKGDPAWQEAALAVFFYGNVATHHVRKIWIGGHEWHSTVEHYWAVHHRHLGEDYDAATHHTLEVFRASMARDFPPPPRGWRP